MPLHVAKFQLGRGETPKCRECNRKYVLDNASLAAANATRSKPDKAKDDKIMQLEKKISELQKQNGASASNENAATQSKDVKQDLKKLQNLLEASKEAGMPTEAIEQQIKKLKEQGEVSNAGLSKVLAKLNASENQEKQIAEQIVKEEEKLQSLKQRAVEAAEKTCKLKEERARLLLVEGHLEQVLPKTGVDMPKIPEQASEPQRKQWTDALQDFQRVQQEQSRLLADTLAQLSASIRAEHAEASKGAAPGATGARTGGAPREEESSQDAMQVETGDTNKSRRGPVGTLPPASGEVSEEQRAKQEAQEQEAEEERRQQKAKQDATERAQQMLEQARRAKLESKDADEDDL